MLKSYRRLESIVANIRQSIPSIKEKTNDIVIQVDSAKREAKFQKSRENMSGSSTHLRRQTQRDQNGY